MQQPLHDHLPTVARSSTSRCMIVQQLLDDGCLLRKSLKIGMERAKGYGGFGQAVLDFILSLGRINAIEI